MQHTVNELDVVSSLQVSPSARTKQGSHSLCVSAVCRFAPGESFNSESERSCS